MNEYTITLTDGKVPTEVVIYCDAAGEGWGFSIPSWSENHVGWVTAAEAEQAARDLYAHITAGAPAPWDPVIVY